MSAALRVLFALGALASLAAAVTGITIYAQHPGSNFYLIGWDELEHRQFADILLTQGSGNIFVNALAGEALTGNGTWGTGLLIGLSRYFFGSELAYIGVKWVLHVLAALLLYRLVSKYRSERLAAYVTMFFLIYPPLLVYGTSFLKDDLVAALVIITAAVIDRRWYVVAAPLLLLMVAVRANAVLFPVILIGYLRRSSLRNLVVLFTIPAAAVLLMLSQERFGVLEGLLHLPPTTVLFFVLKYLLGPIPTNILGYETEAVWIFPWYTLSFLGILAGFLFRGFYTSIRANWLWITLVLGAALAPYLPYANDVDIVGPRQFCTVGWLYFMLFYEKLLGRYGFTWRPSGNVTGWSAAAT